MQQEVQDEEDGATAVNEKQLINNGGSSHKVSKGNAGGGLLGPNNFQSQYSLQKPYESAQGNLQKNASNDVSIENLSMATGSYVGKSRLYRARSAANTKRGGTGKAIFYNNYSHNLEPSSTVESNIKVYIPKEYFKHTGYIKDEESAAASGDAKSRTSMKSRQMPRKPQTPFKERFNEKLEYPNAPSQKSGSKVINQGPRLRHVGPGANGDDSISVLSRVISQVDDFKSKASASDLMSAYTGASGRSRPQTASMMKRKILDRINQLDEK